LCALGVACYHVLGWLQAEHPYNLGLYGVYVFFVMSGASLWIAYADKMAQGYPMAGFFAVRFFRLAPLYWLALLVDHWLERPLRDFGKRRLGWLGRAHPPADQASSLPR
jgi:hypothetical protein